MMCTAWFLQHSVKMEASSALDSRALPYFFFQSINWVALLNAVPFQILYPLLTKYQHATRHEEPERMR